MPKKTVSTSPASNPSPNLAARKKQIRSLVASPLLAARAALGGRTSKCLYEQALQLLGMGCPDFCRKPVRPCKHESGGNCGPWRMQVGRRAGAQLRTN
jgi:hypothetical protein